MTEYIEREAALKLIEKEKLEATELCVPAECKKDFAAGLYRAEKIIKQIPTADVVKVVHGEWVHKTTYGQLEECNCSLCGQLMTTIEGKRMNYCCNCGAKMDVTDTNVGSKEKNDKE